ncbi:hypothetical protein ACQP2T_00075 [Nonomuraea sp. CA-143628]|uniref:hypothetical protein n=1 Tax=Nonomuraea sp. CA-143628 TaxID=3239997 RepID=UPI003D8FCAF0
MTDRHTVSEATTAPWRVDFYESATPLDTTLNDQRPTQESLPGVVDRSTVI